MTAEEVYVFTRLAGDKVGATKMDRPEDVEPSPRTGRVYVALTNNTDRGATGKAGRRRGQPAQRQQARPDPGARRERATTRPAHSFAWRLFLVARRPGGPGAPTSRGFPKDQVSPISCPDNVAFDPHGNLWISTDGNQLGSHDGLFGVATSGERRGELRQFLTVPTGAETCGPIVQDRRVLVAVQHPGEVDGASVEKPASEWPDGPGTYRPAVGRQPSGARTAATSASRPRRRSPARLLTPAHA